MDNKKKVKKRVGRTLLERIIFAGSKFSQDPDTRGWTVVFGPSIGQGQTKQQAFECVVKMVCDTELKDAMREKQ